MRFVLVSFAVLGWIFYEMSGGADFRPPERPVVASKSTPADTTVAVLQPKPVPSAEASNSASAALVAKPAIKPKQPTPDTLATTTNTTTPDTQLMQVRSSLSQGLTLLPEPNRTSPLALVSLELGASGLRTADPENATSPALASDPAPQTPETADPDLREVTGTRVNMRDGPGTIYPVVARLNIGSKVEVLSDSGTGWLRLRTVPGQQLGWIASSLISKSQR